MSGEPKTLILPASLRERIAEEARAAFPRECCGLIEGVWEGDCATVLALHRADNIAAAADRFEIDPAAHFAALKAARTAGRDLIGCYHSHPTGAAAPSAHDLAGGGEENFLWLIAALASKEAEVALAGFAYFAGGFRAVGLRFGGSASDGSAPDGSAPDG